MSGYGASVRVKICGVTRPEDALAAAAAGADAIGLVFYPPSPRSLDIEQARQIVAALPPLLTVVGLFVNEPKESVLRTLEQVPIDVLQFHGDESAAYCESFNRPYLKALRVKPGVDTCSAAAEYASARGILLDTWVEGVPGGTGQSFDWQLVSGQFPAPLVLAGGLNAGNVGTAIAQVSPAAVDVSGGVEISPGVKDPAKVQAFIAAARAAE